MTYIASSTSTPYPTPGSVTEVSGSTHCLRGLHGLSNDPDTVADSDSESGISSASMYNTTAHVDAEAEYRLLASCIHNPHYLLAINDRLFTGTRRSLFVHMREVYQQYGSVTYEALRLRTEVPSELLIARLVPPDSVIEYLQSLALKRYLSGVKRKLDELLYQSHVTPEEIQVALRVPEYYTSRDGSLLDGIQQCLGDMQARKSGSYSYIKTGLPFLDAMLGGEWPRSGLSVIIGQAGGGKTALICQSALEMAKSGIPVLIFSLEMPKAKLVHRFLTLLTSIPSMRLRKGDLTPEEQVVLDDALVALQGLPLYVIDDSSLDHHQIEYYVRSFYQQYGIQAFFIDYIQIVKPPANKESMFESLGEIAQTIRNVARHLSIAAVVLSQQNRQYSGLDSVLGSSRIVHTADVVLEITSDVQTTSDTRLVKLWFRKNREGPVGESSCVYEAPLLRFS